jgi:hypothetical protein
MSRSEALLARLDRASDWLSPLVIKEVRQIVRGRDFMSSFGSCLAAGMLVAFFGAGDALTGEGTSGRWTFVSLMTWLTILGLAVVPLGAFSALRNERMEQTLELITLTALSPRRVVIGKLLAQGVKLATLFAAVAPFIAMSFLLGGVDFVTILIALLVLFMWSLWASAAGLFLSTLLKSRTMSGLVFVGVGIMALMMFGISRPLFFFLSRGAFATGAVFGVGPSPGQFWWTLAITTTSCLMTMTNLVLLAENRLSLPTENRVAALRIGFFAQILLISGWFLTYINEPPGRESVAIAFFGVIGGAHLAAVAMFTLTEDLIVPRRALLQMQRPSRWRWLLTMFGPGGGRGAAYVLAQMAVFLGAAVLFDPPAMRLRWLVAICAYICLFTGVPTLVFRLAKPAHSASLPLRASLLLLLALSLLLPDIIYYLLWQPDVLAFSYGARHLINPFRTLANWETVETNGWLWVPTLLGLNGLASYGLLIQLGRRAAAQPVIHAQAVAAAAEPGSAPAVH